MRQENVAKRIASTGGGTSNRRPGMWAALGNLSRYIATPALPSTECSSGATCASVPTIN